MKYNRIITIVLDSVGIGEQPDAPKFGDFGVNTLGNISKQEGLELPNLQNLGLGNIAPIKTIPPVEKPLANYGKMMEVGDGKDTLTGHLEMMGCTVHQGFKQYIESGFPIELIKEFEKQVGRKVVCNKAGNGMAMIKEFYHENVDHGHYILYTSVDSTWQLAAHEDVIPLEELYAACNVARELTKTPEYNVARVIARPFIGDFENFKRTSNRHDYAVDPPRKTVMQKLQENNLNSIAIGKIADIFNGVGVTTSIKTTSNMDGVDKTIDELKKDYAGFIFTNLVDFDSLYGHPRDVVGYKECLEAFDTRLPEIINALKEDDLLMLVADHGNDPTYRGNDHTREYVPLLVFNQHLKGNNNLGIRQSFEDLGQTICDNFDLMATDEGSGFLKNLK